MEAGKPLAILAFLALSPKRRASRDYIAELFWPTVPLPDARHSLRQSIYRLRDATGRPDVLRSTGVDLALDGAVALDCLEGERALATGAVERAVELLRGNFLEGFELPESSEFSSWVEAERARFRECRAQALSAASHHLLATGDSVRALELAEELAGLQPFSDEPIQLVMTALAHMGRHATAVARYHAYTELLRREMDDGPGEPLTTYCERLEAYLLSRPTPTPTLLPFVGRSKESGLLWEAWRRVVEGSGSTILVEGGAGIGKSRLLAEHARLVHGAGALLLSAKCYEAERSIPYATIGEALNGLVNRPELARVSAGALVEVSRLVPDLSHQASQAPIAFPAAAKQRLHVAVAKCLEDIAACTPVLLQLDDLHWSDHETLEVTHFLVHRLKASRVLILGCYRPAELPPSVRRFTRSLCGERLAQLITLENLSPPDVEQLLTDLAPFDEPAHARALARQLHRHTGGSPLLLTETLGALDRHSILSVREGRWALARDAKLEELAGTLESLVMERVDRLAPWIRACAEAMAVTGSEIGPEPLARALGVSEPRVELALGVLAEERLVCRVGRTRYDLAHEEIRRVVVRSIPEARLRTLEASLTRATDEASATTAVRRPPAPSDAPAAGAAPERSEAVAEAAGAPRRRPRVVSLPLYGAGLAVAAVAGLVSVVLAHHDSGQPPAADVGGTYFNPKRGLEGTTFLFDPVYHGAARYVVTIRGPQGWNRDSAFDCYPTLAPQVRAARRAICWTLSAPPVSGLYRGISVVGADTMTTRFHIDASSALPPPGIQDVSVRPDGVLLRWSAPSQAQAFLVRISALPFGGELTESLVGGTVHQLTLPRPPLEHGRQYQAAIFALGVDITRAGPVPARFNVSVHDWKLRYDSLTDNLVRADPGDPNRR